MERDCESVTLEAANQANYNHNLTDFVMITRKLERIYGYSWEDVGDCKKFLSQLI